MGGHLTRCIVMGTFCYRKGLAADGQCYYTHAKRLHAQLAPTHPLYIKYMNVLSQWSDHEQEQTSGENPFILPSTME